MTANKKSSLPVSKTGRLSVIIVQAQATNFKEDDKMSAANFCTMRDFPLFAKDYYQLLKATMDKLLCNITDEITVVCGQAKGADTLGEQYAMEKGYAIDYYPAQWKLYGKRAGYLRNEQMAQNADALAAFWNGESRGTKHMIELAKRYGLKVRVKRY